MILDELLNVAGLSVNVKCGNNYVENVSRDNTLLATYVFDMEVKDITADTDEYGNFTLEVELEETI